MGRPRKSVLERLLAKVQFTDSCWNWTGWVQKNGYGQIAGEPNGKPYSPMLLVHRVMYEAHKGPIPSGMHVDHLCRNKRCCNPDHLEAVTPAENTQRFHHVPFCKSGRHQRLGPGTCIPCRRERNRNNMRAKRGPKPPPPLHCRRGHLRTRPGGRCNECARLNQAAYRARQRRKNLNE